MDRTVVFKNSELAIGLKLNVSNKVAEINHFNISEMCVWLNGIELNCLNEINFGQM